MNGVVIIDCSEINLFHHSAAVHYLFVDITFPPLKSGQQAATQGGEQRQRGSLLPAVVGWQCSRLLEVPILRKAVQSLSLLLTKRLLGSYHYSFMAQSKQRACTDVVWANSLLMQRCACAEISLRSRISSGDKWGQKTRTVPFISV